MGCIAGSQLMEVALETNTIVSSELHVYRCIKGLQTLQHTEKLHRRRHLVYSRNQTSCIMGYQARLSMDCQ